MLMPRNHEQMIVIPRSDTICVMNMQGQVIKSFASGKKEHGEFVCGTVSPKGEWLYAVTEDRTLFCFSMATAQIEHTIPQAHEREVIGLHHHPHRNMLTSHADDGLVKLWIP
jgi:WD40 repeat-containing protein SMU1